MLQTKHGPFNGTTWENLCQEIFKLKYACDGYHSVPLSPGDFGLEGFTLNTGLAFQCYCPESHYDSKQLHTKQVNKITEDIGKLRTYVTQIAERIGSAKIKEWHFVTPEIAKNALLAHARKKEQEARSWNLPILSSDFQIHLKDIDFYTKEINELRVLHGETLCFDSAPTSLVADGPPEEYEANLRRKTAARLFNVPNVDLRVSKLYELTQSAFLEHDALFRDIEKNAPPVFFRLSHLINEYEIHVTELGITWLGTPDELVAKVRDGLVERICTQLSPSISVTDANKIARLTVARWLAVCALDFDT